MGNRAEIVMEQVQEVCGEDTYISITEKYGTIDGKAKPTAQGKYIKNILMELNATQGEEVSKKVMRPCGYYCITKSTLEKANKLYKDAKHNIENFLELLNTNDLAGGNLYSDNGDIMVVYNQCYCGIPKATKDMPVNYCECSVGWVECLFKSVFDKDVIVEKVQTIIGGSDRCVFRVSNFN
ncbi:MAG: hypothetical protein K0R21_1252 [Anaerocolumna sp.]|jgi:predicted hydrocarbon binding protein|nr:hypothetical protein [Anaerocolumna sp.]